MTRQLRLGVPAHRWAMSIQLRSTGQTAEKKLVDALLGELLLSPQMDLFAVSEATQTHSSGPGSMFIKTNCAFCDALLGCAEPGFISSTTRSEISENAQESGSMEIPLATPSHTDKEHTGGSYAERATPSVSSHGKSQFGFISAHFGACTDRDGSDDHASFVSCQPLFKVDEVYNVKVDAIHEGNLASGFSREEACGYTTGAYLGEWT
ncbi:hypothetical protein CROQUDRAFT_98862 [Cronartium quercuum f. sp. fusiforme G11]|uniref:Uncharacterized protein n=1 Tax=Cronartium quercuum f. sp. fusiforme G11 TaxID=708437 RepID=A0A9P6NC85_9BASI|nr:hypothetical protein CROQUDRAFT_98862 [Cronartium quercuum f. sp. fusiforme G11]